MPFQKMRDDTPASLSILRYWPLYCTPLWTKYEQISLCRIFRALYFKTGKTYKADIHQSNSKYSKDFTNNIQTHSHFSNGPGSPLKVSDLSKIGKPFSFFSFFQDPYTSRWKSRTTLLVIYVQEFYVRRIHII